MYRAVGLRLLEQGGAASEDRGAEELVAVPPIAGAAGRAAGAQDAFVEAVELGAVLRALQPLLARRGRRDGLQPRLDRRILRVEMGEVGDQILDHVHMRQRRDPHLALHLVDRLGAGERVAPVDVHRTGTANPLTAGTAEGEAGIDLVLDLDQRVENHRPGIVEIQLIGVVARILARIGIVAIDLERLDVLRVRRRLGRLPLLDLAVLGQEEVGHDRSRFSKRQAGRRMPPQSRLRVRYMTDASAANSKSDPMSKENASRLNRT